MGWGPAWLGGAFDAPPPSNSLTLGSISLSVSVQFTTTTTTWPLLDYHRLLAPSYKHRPSSAGLNNSCRDAR